MNKGPINDELHYKLLKLLEENPNISQRKLAEEMGVSLGKMNYCIKALIDVGHVKLANFAKSTNKLAYAYVLTPNGIAEKSKITVRFLKAKQKQYETLKEEIAALQIEVEGEAEIGEQYESSARD